LSGENFKKKAVSFNEAAMQSQFDNLDYHKLVYAVVNLCKHKHSSSIGISGIRY
jgi:hypothetical protein